ncbi:MAG: PSD1 and planctomycete cytochrome C domain-containing protein [Verrucomicrobiota bacterium]
MNLLKQSQKALVEPGWPGRLTLVGCWFPSLMAAYETDQVEFFEKRIRPILAQECYECHSDRHKVKAGLRLDSRLGWEVGGDSGPSIIPGDPGNSLLLQTITHQHEEMKMPKAGAKLEDSVLADFERWIADGAMDPRDEPSSLEEIAVDTDWGAISARRAQWWSFQPVSNPEPPSSDRVSHPVDRFLEAAREEAGLNASPLAGRGTVLRRLHYVLTGLPATIAEQKAFVDDWETLGREGAVAKRIDELLGSIHFGERWTQHWLDWYRYTEGHGGQGDPVNEHAAAYRDYLIRAFNENVPYDQLILEHLAGDLIEEPRLDSTGKVNESIIGLAQFRFVEHGFFPVDALDELVKFTDNQIDVVTKATMGLTVSCARCHDHKFDAISHEDYHALFGIFASSRPSHRPVLAPGVIDVHRETLEKQRDNLSKVVKARWLEETSIAAIRERLDLFSETHQSLENDPKKPVETLAGEEEIPQHLLVKAGDALQPWIRWLEPVAIEKGWSNLPELLERLRADAESHNEKITLARYDFRKGIPDGWRLTDGSVSIVGPGMLGISTDSIGVVESILPSGMITHRATAHEQAGLFSHDFAINFGAIAAKWSGAGWPQFRMVVENFPRPGGNYRQQDARHDGDARWYSEQADFWEGNRGYFQFNTRGLAPAPPRGPRGADGKFLPTGAHPNGSWFHVSEVRLLRKENDRIKPGLLAAEVLTTSGSTIPQDRETLAIRYAEAMRETVERWQTSAFSDKDAIFLTEVLRAGLLSSDIEELGESVSAELVALRAIEKNFAASARRFVPGVVESAGFDQVLYERGDHRQPSEPVPRGFLSALGGQPFELKEGTGRLELAGEVTASENVLFHRVIANRIWYHVFGEALVTSVDNFGRTGQKPTHPELLDYLATRIKTTDYNLKDAIRHLVSTELFQLSSAPTSKVRVDDPSNRLWTHSRVRRFDAEIVRDHLLSVSGQLNPKLFGPQVVPNGAVEGDLRRGLYLSRKRKARDAFLDTFDMPLPTSTRGKRDVTTTPSQAITMLNSPFVRHQAQRWAEANEQRPANEALSDLIEVAFTRSPEPGELVSLVDFYNANGANLTGLVETAHLVFNAKEMIYLR